MLENRPIDAIDTLVKLVRGVVKKRSFYGQADRKGSPPPYGQVVVIFQNKLTYFDLFYYFIMGKIGPKFSHLLTVRAKGADAPPPYGQPDRKKTVFFTTSLSELLCSTKGLGKS